MRHRQRGFTLLEVLVASAIMSVAAGGTMVAFIAAGRMMRAQSHPDTAEAVGYAQETMETLRDNIACQPPWFDAACTPTLPVGWQADPLPGPASTNTILAAAARRCYRVTQQNCAAAGDCFAVEVRMCWNDVANCPC